jgi:hypothetical protein
MLINAQMKLAFIKTLRRRIEGSFCLANINAKQAYKKVIREITIIKVSFKLNNEEKKEKKISPAIEVKNPRAKSNQRIFLRVVVFFMMYFI